MPYDPNATWTAERVLDPQSPAYFLRINGLSKDYATHPVLSPAVTKVNTMMLPRGGGLTADPVGGTQSLQLVRVPVLDIAGEMTDLIATEAEGAPLATMINRRATLFGGYQNHVEADYPPIFTGRICGIKMDRTLAAFVFELCDLVFMLDFDIMANATLTKPSTIEGTLVNVYWSILTGTFSTSDPNFPLDSVSTDTADSSVPTGLNIATTLINETQLKDERDIWHGDTTVRVAFTAPENAKEHLESELFRVFQCRPAVSADGLIGLKFWTAVSAADAQDMLESTDIARVVSWRRKFSSHLNSFEIQGDFDAKTGAYAAVMTAGDTAEDTTNQTNTGETMEYKALSRWLHSDLDGVVLAAELVGRLRTRYLETPAELEVEVLFRLRHLEPGDTVRVTHSQLPDLFTGTRGLTEKPMEIVSIKPNFDRGTLNVKLLDTGFRRVGSWGDDDSIIYDNDTTSNRSAYAFIGRTSDNKVGPAALDPGYDFV